ncbi:MAG: hypothetical protein IPM74_02845 [Crocinitomicaceae bacterium]|nr:hypothetical protein [Crocinitomicaceae bacterium]MBK8924854.1 hypothetical protein [Crocinitomicaceae bacterium]
MGMQDTISVLLVVLYLTAGLMLMVAAYVIYLRVYSKRGRLERLNNITFTTSRYEVYHEKTDFLLDLPNASNIKIVLLDSNHQELCSLLDAQLDAGRHLIEFDPHDFDNGTYFISLNSDSTNLLRKITIDKAS